MVCRGDLGRRWAGAGNMADTDYGGSRVTMLYAEANAVAVRLAADVVEPVEQGPLSTARLLEPLAAHGSSCRRRRGMGVAFVIDVVRRPAK